MLQEFLELVPEGTLSGLDTFDLITQLRNHGRVEMAKAIARKVQFRWKMRKRFIQLKFWLLLG